MVPDPGDEPAAGSALRHRYELTNVSKGGLAFQACWPVSRGATLPVQLWLLAKPQPIELVGETRWCTRLPRGFFLVGLRFALYGNGPGMNPPAVLATLRELEAKHAGE
jgi:hypothetical protein